jgi:UMF1 family MFS transporter
MSDAHAQGSSGTRKEVFAWALYDWANSAYSTLSITIVFLYLTEVVLPEGNRGKVVWAWSIGASMFIAAILSPIAGAMADARQNKRTWLAITALPGAGLFLIIAAIPPVSPPLIIGLFVVAALLFELSLTFYNGFLPEIADQQSMNRVSAFGYALGYVGGGLALVATLAIKWGWPSLPNVTFLRLGIAILGFWWGLFSLPIILLVRDRGRRPTQYPKTTEVISTAVREVGKTLGRIRQYRMLALFLLGFLFYNDGIQTVISQASTFATNELAFEDKDLILLILMIQFVAFPGAMFIAWLADHLGQKRVLMLCLGVWITLVTTAYFVTTKTQFWILGIVVALVMGGTQSVSRAIMGMMTPPSRTAEFFGFFNLSGRATGFLGPFLFGAIIAAGYSARLAVLSLTVFFLVGWLVAGRVDIERGRRDALVEH